jgi:hypothetical protein
MNRFVEEKGIRFAYRAFGCKPGVPLLLLAPLPMSTGTMSPERRGSGTSWGWYGR